MKKENKLFIELLENYRLNLPLTEDEHNLFFAYLNDPKNIRLLQTYLSKDLQKDILNSIPEEQKIKSLQHLYKKLSISIKDTKKHRVLPKIASWKFGWAAILIIGLFSASVLLLIGRHPTSKTAIDTSSDTTKQLIIPGQNGALLTLADGTQIVLDSLHNGVINVNNGKALLTNGKLDYKTRLLDAKSTTIAYNTISTPRGRQYQVQLSDGTNVWLNAGSSLKFPTVFSGKERFVEISGEVYFEVQHNSLIPFRVKAGNQIIEDIGTHFDIKAYSDESVIKTTLIEGAVSVSTGFQKVTLKPGQQSEAASGNIKINKVDVNEVTAWKGGFFAFDNSSLDDIMLQLSRWYNVSVEYRNTDNRQHFTGKIDRSLPLADVLKGLQFSKAHFKINENERKIIVLP